MSVYPTLHYSKTNFSTEPQTHINPILLQKYKDDNLLVVCAREPQIKRVEIELKGHSFHDVFGWWNICESHIGYGSKHLYAANIREFYDAVIVVDRERIDTSYHLLMCELEHLCVKYKKLVG